MPTQDAQYPGGLKYREVTVLTGRVRELVKGKKYEIIIEAGRDPQTGKRKRIYRVVNGRKSDAEREMARMIRELEQGTYIEPSKMTVADYLLHWLDAHGPNLAPSTLASYTRIIKTHLTPALGGILLSKLTPLHIQKYYSNKLNEGRADGKEGGLSLRTVRYHHTVLREALQHAVKWGLIHDNPADFTTPPRPKKPEICPLDQNQLAQLLEAAEGHKDKWLYMFAAHSGMRQGEILALTWPAVDIEGKKPLARVRQTMGYINRQGFVFRPIGKSKKALRELTLLDQAAYALRQRRKQQLEEKMAAPPGQYQETDLIFTDHLGRPLDPSGLTRRFKRLATKAGFPNLRFHDLRHTFATFMLEMGIHPKVVQEYLGHETIGITMDTYSHVIPGVHQEAVARVNEYLANRNGGKMAGNTKNHP